MMTSDGPTFTVGDSAWPFVLEAFGWQLDEFGFIVDDDDDLVLDTYDRPIQRHQIGGIVSGENGEPCPMKDRFSAIVANVNDEMPDLPELPEEEIERRNTIYEVKKDEQ